MALDKRAVKRILNELELTSRWSSRAADDVRNYILADCAELWDRPPIEIINIRNGLVEVDSGVLRPHSPREHPQYRQRRVVEVDSGVLRPHSPEHLSPIQLPVVYDPAARCPNWERCVDEWFPPDARELAWEIPAWLMTPNVAIQKAILLVGEGANGKSRYLEGIRNFLGPANTSGLSLQKLEGDRFSAARLVGKLANICPDLPSQHLETVSVFKALVGGDALTAERKFHDSFDVRPFARLIFSANHLPQSKDGSHGFFRRWLVVPFNRTFAAGEQIDQVTLDGMLSMPQELSGLFNKSLEALRRLNRQRGFTVPMSVLMAIEEFRATTDPLAVWLDQFSVTDTESVVSCDALLTAFNNHAKDYGIPVMTKSAFGAAVKRMRPGLATKQRTISQKLVWCYVGLGLREADHSQDSRTSRTPSTCTLSQPRSFKEQSEK